MAITIEVNEKTRQFDLHAVIEIDLMNIAQAELLSLTIKCLKSTTLIYLKALKSNKKILGNDRVRLIEKLDLLVTYLLLFFDSLNNNNELFSSDELNIGYTKMDNYIEISGNIDSSDYKSVINFNDSFNKNITIKLKEIIKFYRKILKKDNRNIKIVYKKIENLIIYILVLRTKLEDCLIDY